MGTGDTDQDKWEQKQEAQAERIVGTAQMGDLIVQRKEQAGVTFFDFAIGGSHCAMDTQSLARLVRMLAALADLGVGERG